MKNEPWKNNMIRTITKKRGADSVWTKRFIDLCEQDLIPVHSLQFFYLPKMLKAKEPKGE